MFLTDLPPEKDFIRKKDTFVSNWFRNEDYTPWAQIISSFALGTLLSPWGMGVFVLFLFLLLYELFYYIYTGGEEELWQSNTRVCVILGYVLGWIIGRSLFFAAEEIMKEGVPDPLEYKQSLNDTLSWFWK